MKIILINPPFCTPITPSYSIARLSTFLQKNLPKSFKIKVLDLNSLFHAQKFPQYLEYFKSWSDDYDLEEYKTISEKFVKESMQCHAMNNKRVIHNEKPELVSEMLELVVREKPDLVAFSLVYPNQAFYSYSLLSLLQEKGIKTVVGGPSVLGKLLSVSIHLKNEIQLLEFILGEEVDHQQLVCDDVIDYRNYDFSSFFSTSGIIPVRTSISCFYKQCAFCTYHGNQKYKEVPLADIVETIKLSGKKYVFFIDAMITKKRLLKIAAAVKDLGISWMCQLRPTRDLDRKTLKILYDSGLKAVLWGVESGSQRILDLMKKGTTVTDVATVLRDSYTIGIKNSVYIMFGFPTETKEEFLETIEFLKKNSASIHLVSTSIFGLQKGAPIYYELERFGIKDVKMVSRTILEPKIVYTIGNGLSPEEAMKLRQKYKRTIEKIGKFPKSMNHLREHLMFVTG